MIIETALEEYPRESKLKDGSTCQIRPLQSSDEKQFHEFFLAVPESERMFIKHRVVETQIIREWCQNIDYGRNLPLLALIDDKVIASATLHQQHGGWKRHIGRVSVLVHPGYRGRGLARSLVLELIDLARQAGLEKIEAEFIAEQEAAIKMFGLLGFHLLVKIPDYVKDMQTMAHDYVLMGLDLDTDEEFAGMG